MIKELELHQLIGQKINKVSVSDDKKILTLESNTLKFLFEGDSEVIDSGEAWLDDENENFSLLVNTKIVDCKVEKHYASQDEQKRMLNKYSVYAESANWTFIDLISDKGTFTIRFFCTDGTYYAGNVNFKVVMK